MKVAESVYLAVINSLLYQETNGIVESKVKTTKLTKKIMYGKSSFELIKNKTLRLQSLRQLLLERAIFALPF